MVPSLLPRTNGKMYFQKGDVKESFNSLSVFQGLTYKINKKTALLIPDRFRMAKELYEMLDESDSKKYRKN